MIDLAKLEVFTPREKTDYLNGVRSRLEEAIDRGKARSIYLAETILQTDLAGGQVSRSFRDHAQELGTIAESILQDQAALRLILSSIVSVREEHYRESNELL